MNLAHIGYVVENVDSSLKRFLKEGAEIIIPPITDKIQKVKICLLCLSKDVNIELVAPIDLNNSPIMTRLTKGGGLDHLCFFTNDIDKSLDLEERNGSIIVCPPVWSVAFNQKIAFVHRRSGLIVEFLEKK